MQQVYNVTFPIKKDYFVDQFRIGKEEPKKISDKRTNLYLW